MHTDSTALRPWAVWLGLLAGAVACSPAEQRRSPPGEPGIAAPIPQIQGRSHYSPMAGRTVLATGVVTAVAGRTATVQDPTGDGDPTTSDGVMLEISGGLVLRAGDAISFSGRVTESVPGGPGTANLSLTTIAQARVRVLSRGNDLPRPVPLGAGDRPVPGRIIGADELPVTLRNQAEARANRFDPASNAIDFYESLEGMRVTVPAPVAVSAVQALGRRSGEVVVLAEEGRGIAPGRRTAAGGILLQSGPENRGSQNPERIQIQFDSALYDWPLPAIAVGDRLEDVTGILRYDFGNYEVAALEPVRAHSGGIKPESTSLVGESGRLTLASYNVLNLSAQPEDSAQRRLLAGQVVARLGAPGILALQEIQDESGERDDGTTDAAGTLRALAEAIRRAGGPEYRYFDVAPADGRQGGARGGNIRNAFLYRPDRVSLVSFESLTPDRLADVPGADTGAFRDSRDPLAGVFDGPGGRIIVINNHLSSRYGSTPAFGAVQPFVQAGEASRAAQVGALRAYVARRLAQDSSARIVVLGDMNTFEFTDDLALLLPGRPPILHSLMARVPAAERYSYNYEGNSQLLDHVFVTGALLAGAELDIVHLNVDFPSSPGATASDHDPLVARFR